MRWDEFLGVFIEIFLIIMGLFRQIVHSPYGTNIGINTPCARKSKDNWDFVQEYAPVILIKYGFCNMLLSLFLVIFCEWIGRFIDIVWIAESVLSVFILIMMFFKIE